MTYWARLAIVHAVIAISLGASSLVIAPAHFTLLAPVAHGQLVLLAVWLPFSPVGLLRRFAIYIALGTLISAIGLNVPRWAPHFSELLFIAVSGTIFILLIVSLPMFILRLLGWRLTSGPTTPPENAPWQLSISTALALTLLVALLLTLQQLVTSMGIPNSDGSIVFPNNSYGLLVGIVMVAVGGLGQCWAVISAVLSCLAIQGHRSRLIATLIVVTLICTFPMHARGGQTHLISARMFAISMATVILSLLYLRHESVRILAPASHAKCATEPCG